MSIAGIRTAVMAIILSSAARAQVLCVLCHHQNERVAGPVTNLLLNGSFEEGTCAPYPSGDVFCPNADNYACDVADWTCSGGGASTYAQLFDTNSAIVVEGTKAIYLGNDFCIACPSLDLSCLTRDGCVFDPVPTGFPNNSPDFGGTTGVSLGQTANGLTVGNIHVLEFWAGGENFGVLEEQGLFAVDVGYGRILLPCRPTMAGSGAIGDRYQVVFTATSAQHTITFTNWGHIASTATELVLDDVRLFEATATACATGSQAPQVHGPVEAPVLIGTNVLVGAPGSNGTLQVFDGIGRLLVRRSFTGRTLLPVPELAHGPYMYRVDMGDGSLLTGRMFMP